MSSPITSDGSAPLVALIGGTGFIGRYAAQALARAGCRLRIASRRPNEAIAVQTYGDVGQIALMQANVRNEASVARVVKGADAVVNFVGILGESGGQTFDALQAEGAGLVARKAVEAGVKRIVHVSAIGADAESLSNYARTKALGEAAMQAAAPGAVILRPSIVFGPEDQFFNRFASMARYSPAVPIVCAETRFQPVYVGDVAEAVRAAVLSPAEQVEGKTFELGGPRAYRFDELIALMLKTIHRRRIIGKMPYWMGRMQASMLDLMPLLTFGALPNTLLTVDQVRLLKKDNVVSDGALGLADLGIDAPATVEAVIPSYLMRFRPHGQFDDGPLDSSNAA